MKIEWEYFEESETQLEKWTHGQGERRIEICLIGGTYYWSDNLTGTVRWWGNSPTLEEAMRHSLVPKR